MYDFCLTFPYAALLILGGLVGFITKGSTGSLAGGLAGGAALAYCAHVSLQHYHRGRLCLRATALSLVIAAGLAVVMGRRSAATGKFMPAGLVAATSAAMVAFYAWHLVFKPAPPGGKAA